MANTYGPMSEAIQATTKVQFVKAALVGEASDGSYRTVRINPGGALAVADFGRSVASGALEGLTYISKFGRNSLINTSTDPEDVWEGGGLYTGQPMSSPETVEVFSSDAADGGGTGMNSIRIYGLTSNSDTSETTELISLNGTTPVTSVNQWYRVYRAEGVAYGSGGTNAGTITVRHSSTTANVFAGIAAGRGQTSIAAWTVPAGVVAWIMGLYIGIGRTNGSAGSAGIDLNVRSSGSGGYNAKRTYFVTTAFPVKPPLMFPIPLAGGDDVKITVETVSDNNTQVFAEMDILIDSN